MLLHEEKQASEAIANLLAEGTAIGIPTLDNDNFNVWLYTLKAFAAEHDFTPHLEGEVELPQNEKSKKVALKHKAQAGRIIIATMHNDLLRELGRVLTT